MFSQHRVSDRTWNDFFFFMASVNFTMTNESYDDYYQLLSDVNQFLPCNTASVRIFSQSFLPTLYSIVFIAGLVGNGLVVCVLVRYHKTSNMSDLCLFNLAISDLLFIFSLPFWAHYAAISEWTFGDVMCHTVTGLYTLGFYGSMFFTILITTDRYAVIVHTHTLIYPKHPSAKARTVLTLFMWTLSLVASLPNIIFSQVHTKKDVQVCMQEYPHNTTQSWKLFFYIELNVLGLIIPLSVMVFCYSRIISILITMRSQKKHKALKLVILLLIVFFLFWTPYNIAIFLKFLHQLGYMQTCQWSRHLQMAMQWVETIAFCHCCLNPIIYTFVGQKFRNLCAMFMKEYFPVCFGRSTATENGSTESPTCTCSQFSVIFSTRSTTKE